MPGTLCPFVHFHELDDDGAPAAGYQLFTYVAGTSTKLATYSDVDLTSANTNPIILDSAGRAVIYLRPGNSYKFVFTDSTDTDPPASPVWTQDNINTIPGSNVDVDVAGTAGESISDRDCCYLSEGDGSRTAGQWYKADADLNYASSKASQIGFALSAIASGESGSFRTVGRVDGMSALTAGTKYYASDTAGALTATATSLANTRLIGTADSTTSILLSHWLRDASPMLEAWTSTVGNEGAGEDTLATYSAAAGALNVNEMALNILFWGATADNANAKTIKLHIDDGTNDTTIITATPTVSEAGEWLLGCKLMRTGATTGRACAQIVCGPSGGPSTVSVPAIASPTVVWSAAVEIRLTGEATTTDDITMQGGSVTLVTV